MYCETIWGEEVDKIRHKHIISSTKKREEIEKQRKEQNKKKK